jgi:UDP-GlcNAc:undecaprenyl-phosphate GlcNAc-1-phosphate transferase
MGDAGSQLLGFLAVTLSLHISQVSEPMSRTFPLLLLGFPILDTLAVMMERIRKKVSPFKADKNHFHHKLLRLGLRHDEAVVAIYILQFLLVLSAFVLRFHSEWTLLLIYLAFSVAVLVGFHWTDKNGWKLSRRDFLDQLVQEKLGSLYNYKILIKSCFGLLELGTPLLLFTCCLGLVEVPMYVGIVSLSLLLGLIAIAVLLRSWNIGMLRLILFIMIPYLVFIAHMQLPQLVNVGSQVAYHLSFGLMVILGVLTLKFTRRRKGFKANPFDFLIILASFLVTSVPEIKNTVADVSLITAKMIALFFAFEVLLGEIRAKVFRLNLFMVFTLGMVFVKSLL